MFRFFASKLKIKLNQFLELYVLNTNMAKLIDAVVVIVPFVVVVLLLCDVVLLIGLVAAVVVCIWITSGWLFSVAIVTIPAMNVATNITNETTILKFLLCP